MKNQKRTRMIEHARKLVETRNNAKWEICRIALEVCDIQQGGHGYNKDLYTITKFAEDISMSSKTLSCWILDYKFAKDAINLDRTLSTDESNRLNSSISRARLEITPECAQIDSFEERKELIKKQIENNLKESGNSWRLRAATRNMSYFYNFIKGAEEYSPQEIVLITTLQERTIKLTKLLKKVLKEKDLASSEGVLGC